MDNRLVVLCLDENKSTVMKSNMNDLPLKRKGIIRKSIELFNDSEPCIIHRTFVINKIIMEIETYFKQVMADQNVELPLECIPDNISMLMELEGNIKYLKVGYDL